MDGAGGAEGADGADGRMDGNDGRVYERTLNDRCPRPMLINFMSWAAELAGIVCLPQ